MVKTKANVDRKEKNNKGYAVSCMFSQRKRDIYM